MNVSEVKRADALVRELEWLEMRKLDAIYISDFGVYTSGARGVETNPITGNLHNQIREAANALIAQAIQKRKKEVVAELKALGVDPSMPGDCDD